MSELKMTLQEWAEYNELSSAEVINHLLQAAGNAAAMCIHHAEEKAREEEDGDGIEAFQVLVGRDGQDRVLQCDYRFVSYSQVRGTELDDNGAQMVRSPSNREH